MNNLPENTSGLKAGKITISCKAFLAVSWPVMSLKLTVFALKV